MVNTGVSNYNPFYGQQNQNLYPYYTPSGYIAPYYSNPSLYSNSQSQQNTTQVQQPTINWVQGEAGAKSFNLGAGQTVLLMDSEESVFYIKSTDESGMPLPLRIFDYKEREASAPQKENKEIDMSNYITREEFEDRIKNINYNQQNNVNNKRRNKNESFVQSSRQ